MKHTKNKARQKRHLRIRKKIVGTSSKPRLCVYKSNRFFYAQLIDDNKGETIAAAHSLKMGLKNPSNIDAAKAVGNDILEKMKSKKIIEIVFDRSGYIYHGKIKAFAETLREKGIKF
ncbi:50S ribosomal protein L18 [Spiroplasma endosymbiont of Aspidapion aeneum]|uniref:50S ribosomal protein L18 n=1 Tax=Spiroplasma endosymbiont of Aspidapion aeneum TaxID=3066276 RepID=UPI00313AD0E6